MESKCGTCGTTISNDESLCPICGHINKHPNPNEWMETRRKFLDALKRYIPQCPNCGA
jgi:rubrerythrin